MTRLNAKEASEKSAEYLNDLRGIPNYDIQLEEVELSPDEKYWLVTLSFPSGYLGNVRNYRIFKVNAETGEVLSMKIRNQ